MIIKFDARGFSEALTVFINTGQHAAAAALIGEALEKHPRDAHANYEAGKYYSRYAFNHRKKIPAQDLLKLRTTAYGYFCNASEFYKRRFIFALHAGMEGRLIENEAAVKYIRRALEIEPENERAWLELGLAHQKAENKPTALICFQNAARLKPGDEAARVMITSMGATVDPDGPVDYTAINKPLRVKVS